MCSQWAVLAMSAVAILAKPLAPPATGWLYTDGTLGSFIFPFTATQCEPFYIFYNATYGNHLDFYDATISHILFSFDVPHDTGYLEWICNIPAGIEFFGLFKYIVQPGSSSACLGNITTTYSLLTYSTTDFASYTRNPSSFTPLSSITSSTTSFPIGAYSTFTLNSNLAVTPTTSPPLSSSPVIFSTSSPPSPTTPPPPTSPPSPSPTPSHKSRNAAVAGGVVGAVAFVTLIVALVLWRRRRSSFQAGASSPIDPQPASISGLATGELESMDLSSPFRFSGAEFLRGAQQYQLSPPDPRSHRTEPTSDNPILVQMTGTPAAHVYPIVGQRTAQGITTPLDPESVLPSQRPREPPGGRPQAPFHKSVPDLASRASPTADPQPPPSAQPSDAVTHTAQVTALPDATPLLQSPLTSGTQEDPPDLAAVLGVISRARLSARERQIVASVNNLLAPEPSASPDLTRQNTTASSPPPYSG